MFSHHLQQYDEGAWLTSAHARYETKMALTEKEKWWLEEHLEELVEHLDPRETITRLRTLFPDSFDSQDADNVLLKHQTPLEQTGALVNILKTRPREALQAFYQVVSIYQPSLASLLWPVSYSVHWLTPSPWHAAVVVYLLNTFTNTRFLPSQDGGPGFLVRRSFGGAFGKVGVSLTLAFPSKPDNFPSMVRETCKQANFVILTGSCESLGPRLSAGGAVVPLSATDSQGTVFCRAAQRVRDLQATLEGRVRRATWLEGHRKLYSQRAYLDYWSAWLGRLYVEMNREEGSKWMERQGVAKDGGGVASRVQEWETGELARHVLSGGRGWNVNHTSPLGISPNPELVTRVLEKVDRSDTFPSPIDQSPPSTPVFNPLSTSSDGISSPNASLFFRTCSSQLATGTDWLACLGLCYDMTFDTPELSAHTSVTMAIEIVQMLMSSSIDK